MMTVRFVLSESFYDCELQITDAQGMRSFRLGASVEEDAPDHFLDIDICGSVFDLTVIPAMMDYRSMLDEFDQTDWKDRFAKKATNMMLSAVEKVFLRVGCRYHIQRVQDGTVLTITNQHYTFGTFDRWNLLELIPMMYMFFEVSQSGDRCALTEAFETNRNDVVRAARKIAAADILGNGFLATLITYPLQVGRIKRLCKNKKIFKTLYKFHTMDDAERQKICDQEEHFFGNR